MRSFHLSNQWPPTLQSVVEFTAWLSTQGVSPSTAKSYMAGIGFHCKISGFVDVTQFFIITKMLSGMTRLDARVDQRFPISPELLVKIIQVLPVVCSSVYETTLFSAIFSLAFYGFLRVGELVVASKGEWGHALLAHTVKVKDHGGTIELELSHSKTDQAGKGVIINLQKIESPTCPVSLVKQFLAIRKRASCIFFCHFDGIPVTRYQFSALLKKSLNAIGLHTDRYRSHSFRMGQQHLQP